jgi:hypothetical protein
MTDALEELRRDLNSFEANARVYEQQAAQARQMAAGVRDAISKLESYGERVAEKLFPGVDGKHTVFGKGSLFTPFSEQTVPDMKIAIAAAIDKARADAFEEAVRVVEGMLSCGSHSFDGVKLVPHISRDWAVDLLRKLK